LDSKGDIAKSFGVKIYPTTVLIDSKGVARWKIEGDVDWTTPLVNDWIKSLDIQHTRR
jgi:thioredoxin-related protein